jgi:hypothetical protein
MLKSCLSGFALCAIATFVTASAVSLCKADNCTSNAQVCAFTIDAHHYCTNGVGSNSIMADPYGAPFNYMASNLPCGIEWYTIDWISYQDGNTCGDGVTVCGT